MGWGVKDLKVIFTFRFLQSYLWQNKDDWVVSDTHQNGASPNQAIAIECLLTWHTLAKEETERGQPVPSMDIHLWKWLTGLEFVTQDSLYKSKVVF